jgi:prepilin-type N-terminal cleavage/methylation domain-containing protein
VRRSWGFSLVELLVVIGVIAVLAAIMAPVCINAKKSAVRSACQSNLSQMGRALNSYLSDYDSSYPNTDNQYLWSGYYWRETMRKYVGISRAAGSEGTRQMILACPADPTPSGIYAGTSYAYSAAFYMTPDQIDSVADGDYLRTKYSATNPKLPCSTIKTSLVRFASKKIMVAEYWTLHSADTKVGWYDGPESGNDPWSGERNCLFADNHVKYVPTKQIHPAQSPLVSRSRSLPDINLTRNGVYGKDID